MQLWYNKPAGKRLAANAYNDGSWSSEALPLGNGRIGAMIFGDVYSDRIQINEETLWSGGPGKNPDYNGGTTTASTDLVHESLQNVRRVIQDEMTNFTKNNTAHRDSSGNLITSDYPDMLNPEGTGTFAANLNQLKGIKDDYGSYQTVGNIYIEEKDGIPAYTDNQHFDYDDYNDSDGYYKTAQYKRILDIGNAIQTVTYIENGVTYKREYFINNPDNVMAIRLSASQNGKISKNIRIDSEQINKTIAVDKANHTITMEGRPSDHPASSKFQFAQQLKVINSGGTVTGSTNNNKSGTLTINGADSVVILMTVGTNYQSDGSTSYHYFASENPLDAVKKRIQTAENKGFDTLLLEHKSDYKELFDRVHLNLGTVILPDKTTDVLLKEYDSVNTKEQDLYLETLFYQYGRYLLIASSRENSLLPANLQGIWAEGLYPAWSSDFHTNINLQMNYWLSEQT
ncbi:MAG: glycoside hydrolase family 95 protein, partial [Lachnoclostridium sp.]|nr:glycoside hydrolase family 95 protein [Lachnoclostridium sp.]